MRPCGEQAFVLDGASVFIVEYGVLSVSRRATLDLVLHDANMVPLKSKGAAPMDATIATFNGIAGAAHCTHSSPRKNAAAAADAR